MNLLKTKYLVFSILLGCCLIFLIAFAGCGSGNDEPNNNGSPGDPPVVPTSFDVTNVTVSPEKIFIGETATISVTLVNSGNHNGSQNIELYLNGTLESQQLVYLGVGESKTISFSVVKNESDRYWIGIEDLGIEQLNAFLYIWPFAPVLGEHGEGPFCSECH